MGLEIDGRRAGDAALREAAGDGRAFWRARLVDVLFGFVGLVRELVHEVPDYQPARTNLALLGSQVTVARGETAATKAR